MTYRNDDPPDDPGAEASEALVELLYDTIAPLRSLYHVGAAIDDAEDALVERLLIIIRDAQQQARDDIMAGTEHD